MRLSLIKYGNITLTIRTIHRAQSRLCLLFLVRLGGYIVNSLDSSYMLIGKLTVFFSGSGVQLALPNRGLFHYRRAAFSATLKAKVGSTLAKAEVLRETSRLLTTNRI
jgi:hypothetical protein